MLVSASITAHSVFSSMHSTLREGQRPDQAKTVHPSAEGIAAGHDGAAAARKVQPASQTEEPDDTSTGRAANGEALSEEEQQQVRELARTDAEVRAHEQAHAATGGPYASSPSYEFTTGPDGKRYAISGEVQIDSSVERGDPEATIRKMDVVIRAALAPADPSSQDQAVARDAQQKRAQAQIELSKQRAAERDGETGETGETGEIGETGLDASSGGLLSQLMAQAAQAYQDRTADDAAALAGEIFSAAI